MLNKRHFIAAVAATALLSAEAATAQILVVSYSPSSQHFGWAIQPDAFTAAGTANINCGMFDCQTLFWTTSCGAVATGAFGAYGWSWNTYLVNAESAALANCQASGQWCQLQISTCAN